MTNFLHTGHVNVTFERILSKVDSWLIKEHVQISGFESDVIRSRLIQKIIELAYEPYSCGFLNPENTLEKLENQKEYSFKKIKIDNVTGRVQLPLVFFLFAFIEYAYDWKNAFLAILRGFVRQQQDLVPATILYGVSWDTVKYNGSDRRFYDFCKNGNIEPLKKFQKLFIQNGEDKRQGNFPELTYLKNPVMGLVETSKIGFFSRCHLLVMHLFNLFHFLLLGLKNPSSWLLSRDIALLGIIKFFDKKKLIDSIVITISTVNFQPLWMRNFANRNFRTHMIHYAQNTRPFIYKQDLISSSNPVITHCLVDEHWVWTQGYKDYLASLGHKCIHVVGPIMLYLPEEKALERKLDGEFKIAIFDVTPVRREREIELGLIRNYYSSDNMLKFLDGVFSLKTLEKELGRPIKLELKHKRIFHPVNHDKKYIALVKEAEEKSFVKIIDHDLNLYSYLKECSLVVCVPYTSIAYVATLLNVPCIFFDVTEEIVPSFEAAPGVSMSAGVNALRETARSLLVKSVV